ETIAVSNAVKNKIDPTLSNKKISVLYNGVNLSEFSENQSIRSKARKKLSISENSIVISIIGTISDYKGQDLVIYAFKNIKQLNTNNIYLLIVGRCEDVQFLDFLKKSSCEFQNESIKFIDHTDNILEIYNCIDILVNATKSYRSEPLGTTIIEAMALKKLVVASNTGGSPEIVDDMENGFIFEVDDENSLTAKLGYIINNFQNLDHIRNNARKKVQSTFEIELMTENYNNLLTK
ncbi:MAG: glycosyltransferase family 4 protein, partial [Cytophagales bacterium]|nr:glycosyltransferase family 4 protein [Cytophagales bacterium]